MGLIGDILGIIFGGGRNAIRETVEVFRPNAEAADVREAAKGAAALAQFAAEFGQPRKGLFDRFVDGLNRLPRPFLAFGTLGLFVAAMVDPIWFSQRMQGIALVPQPLWWLMGAIVSFYFGARHQAKSHDLQRSLAETLSRTTDVVRNIQDLGVLRGGETEPVNADADQNVAALDKVDAPLVLRPAPNNAALEDWRQSYER